MSKYPQSPYWCHEHDHPIQLGPNDWDRAVADGHVTAEHIVQRLLNMAEYGSAMGVNEDGFLVALTAEGMRLQHGISLCVYPNDHPPPHVHVRLRSHPPLKLRINLETGELMDPTPPGTRRKVRASQGLRERPP